MKFYSMEVSIKLQKIIEVLMNLKGHLLRIKLQYFSANQFNEEFSFENNINFEEIPIIKNSATYEFQSESSYFDSEYCYDQEEKM